MMQRRRFHKTALTLLTLLGLAAWSSDDDSIGTGAPTGDLLLTDAPADELAYLRAVVDSFELELEGGGFTADLLDGNVAVDILRLEGLANWLARTTLPEGTYVGARITFDGLAFGGDVYEAAAPDGTGVAVTPTSNVLLVSFPTPVVVAAGSYTRFTVDFDVNASVSGDAASGIAVDPRGVGLIDTGSVTFDIDDIKGLVASFDANARTLVVAAYADGDLDVPIGNVLVTTTLNTLYIDEDEDDFASPASFFGELVAGQSRVEIEGQLVGSTVQATKIEIDDDLAQPGADEVELRGIIVALNGTTDFDLLWTEVEQGQTAFQNAFAPGSPPAVLTGIQIDANTRIELESDQIVDATALAVGQEVEVKFEVFGQAPFTADEIEIEDEFPELTGVIADTAALPTSFELTLDVGQSALTGGAVDPGAPVTVLLTGASIVYDEDDGPALQTGDLSVGLRVEVRGALSGVSNDPDLAADRVEVEAGELEGAIVASLDEANSSFTTTGGTVDAPLGNNLSAGPLTIVIEPQCVFVGAATSASAFFALGTGIEVDLEGIADTGAANTLRVFEVESELD